MKKLFFGLLCGVALVGGFSEVKSNEDAANQNSKVAETKKTTSPKPGLMKRIGSYIAAANKNTLEEEMKDLSRKLFLAYQAAQYDINAQLSAIENKLTFVTSQLNAFSNDKATTERLETEAAQLRKKIADLQQQKDDLLANQPKNQLKSDVSNKELVQSKNNFDKMSKQLASLEKAFKEESNKGVFRGMISYLSHHKKAVFATILVLGFIAKYLYGKYQEKNTIALTDDIDGFDEDKETLTANQ